jgi:hypothetical protein
MILKWIWERMWWYWLDWSGSGSGPLEGFCEHVNEPLGSIKCWEDLEQLHNWWLLKKGSAPWVSKWFILPTVFQPHSGPWHLIHFRNYFSQTVGLLGRATSTPQGRYLNTVQHKHRLIAYTHQTPMPWVGFEPTIPGSKREKTVVALDRAVTVIGEWVLRWSKYYNTTFYSRYLIPNV